MVDAFSDAFLVGRPVIALDWRGRTRHVLQYRSAPQAPQQRIWGVTASILFNLRERLASVAMEVSR